MKKTICFFLFFYSLFCVNFILSEEKNISSLFTPELKNHLKIYGKIYGLLSYIIISNSISKYSKSVDTFIKNSSLKKRYIKPITNFCLKSLPGFIANPGVMLSKRVAQDFCFYGSFEKTIQSKNIIWETRTINERSTIWAFIEWTVFIGSIYWTLPQKTKIFLSQFVYEKILYLNKEKGTLLDKLKNKIIKNFFYIPPSFGSFWFISCLFIKPWLDTREIQIMREERERRDKEEKEQKNTKEPPLQNYLEEMYFDQLIVKSILLKIKNSLNEEKNSINNNQNKNNTKSIKNISTSDFEIFKNNISLLNNNNNSDTITVNLENSKITIDSINIELNLNKNVSNNYYNFFSDFFVDKFLKLIIPCSDVCSLTYTNLMMGALNHIIAGNTKYNAREERESMIKQLEEIKYKLTIEEQKEKIKQLEEQKPKEPIIQNQYSCIKEYNPSLFKYLELREIKEIEKSTLENALIEKSEYRYPSLSEIKEMEKNKLKNALYQNINHYTLHNTIFYYFVYYSPFYSRQKTRLENIILHLIKKIRYENDKIYQEILSKKA